MAETKTLNLRIDADLKHQAETIFSNLGISTSTAINLFLRSVVRNGGFPFDLRISPNERETLKAINDVNHHRNLSKTYDNIEAVLNSLNS